MPAPWELIKLLADPTRLRVLCLLRAEELSVAELQEILGMGQSRISSHLAQLRQAGLLNDRRDGRKTFYAHRRPADPVAAGLVEAAAQAVAATPEAAADAANLARVLEKRRQIMEQYFNRVAERIGRNACPGRSWEAIGHCLLRLLPEMDIADLGAGEGILANLLARSARRVYCIDNSPRMVELGTDLAQRNGVANLEYRLGDIEKVPLQDAAVDLAVLSQALHHAIHPPQALAEAFRILRPGGRLVVIDLLEHDFEKAREIYADHWLGFPEGVLHGWIRAAGFGAVEVQRVAREAEPPGFTTLAAFGSRPAA